MNEFKNKSLIQEIWSFIMVRKLWWMIPLIFMILFSAVLIVVGSGSGAVSPFIYPLF